MDPRKTLRVRETGKVPIDKREGFPLQCHVCEGFYRSVRGGPQRRVRCQVGDGFPILPFGPYDGGAPDPQGREDAKTGDVAGAAGGQVDCDVEVPEEVYVWLQVPERAKRRRGRLVSTITQARSAPRARASAAA